jgi:hypothetical protein
VAAYRYTLLRTIVPVVADPDWETTQVAPDPSICVDLTGVFDGAELPEIGLMFLADTGGNNVAGTVTIQPVEVTTSNDVDRATIVVGGAVESALPTGRETLIPSGFRALFTVRLVSASVAIAAADRLKIFYRRVS